MVLHFYLVTRATAGAFTTDVWEQLQVEDLPSAVAVTASGQMLGKNLQQRAQITQDNFVHWLAFICHSGRFSII